MENALKLRSYALKSEDEINIYLNTKEKIIGVELVIFQYYGGWRSYISKSISLNIGKNKIVIPQILNVELKEMTIAHIRSKWDNKIITTEINLRIDNKIHTNYLHVNVL